MRVFPSLAPALFALALLPTFASAEPGTNTQIKLVEAAYRQQIGPYAECVVTREDAALAAFLQAGTASSDASKKAKRLARSRPSCAAPSNQVDAAPLLLRGAIFEALYRRDFTGVVVPVTLTDVAPARYGGNASGDETLDTMRQGVFALFDCVVRKDPRLVTILLSQAPDSDGEWLASGGLAPLFSECGGKNLRLEFSAAFARPYISEIRYTLMRLRARAPS